jgi:Fe-S cluster biogenesis protein NfuA
MMTQEMPNGTTSDILVKSQDTPNPMAIKFVANQVLKENGKATFLNATQAEPYPMIAGVFGLPGVKQVYLSQNTMTVSHEGELPNEIISSQVEAIIKSRYNIHNKDIDDPSDESPKAKSSLLDRSHLSPERRQIEEILDRTIRPGLQSDGGDIEVLSYENNEVKILYQGACGGCPSSMMGTLDAIQSILSHEMANPELRVYPV